MATVFLTTQPGWAFATLAELRAWGVEERIEFHHRDSTLALPAEALPTQRLVTPADTHGALAEGYAAGQWDATRTLVDELWRTPIARGVEWWRGPPKAQARRRAQTWTVAAEVWGETQVQRRTLADAARQAVRAGLPSWREAPPGEADRADVRLAVKADTQAAVLGVQLTSNLAEARGGRVGALREHLACGLLSVAGLAPGAPGAGRRETELTVADPFAGSGTILAAAARHYGVRRLVGAEVDRNALREARRRIEGRGAALDVRPGSFEALDGGTIAEGAYLVSNLPFGERFEQVETGRLVAFLREVAPRLAGVALLMAREQGAEVGRSLGLRVKNVIVLGQPAAIAYGTSQRM